MGVALVASFVSVLFGFYYFIRAFYIAKDSKNYKRIQHYFITAFIYLIFVPIIVITTTHSFIAPLLAMVAEPIQTTQTIILTATEVVHERNPLHLYMFVLSAGAICYWIYRSIKFHKRKN